MATFDNHRSGIATTRSMTRKSLTWDLVCCCELLQRLSSAAKCGFAHLGNVRIFRKVNDPEFVIKSGAGAGY